MLEISELEAAYGDARVLAGVSLSVDEGEIVALLGPNGAGKSTLVRSVAGMLPPTAGWVRVNGVDVTRTPPHRVCTAGIAVVPEGRRLFPRLTVRENLEIGAYAPEAKAYLKEGLEHVYGLFPVLEERRAQRAGTLSGGEQQMVAIGRALVARPRFLLMDEPSLGLSPLLVETMFGFIERIGGRGVGVLLVEQNVAKTLEIAARGYVLEQGTITERGSREELLASPRIREAYLAL
ncbi:MAG: ATP-binding cassette domain-containing protein [Streptosporangiales bacterium]|nr:ATP-binding cassette domain-containing protein [Streptosporangiales bacterium]